MIVAAGHEFKAQSSYVQTGRCSSSCTYLHRIQMLLSQHLVRCQQGLAHSQCQSPICNPSQTFVARSGHSLGGVMAVLAAFDIADLQPWASLQVYTVGAPRPGNRGLCSTVARGAPHVACDQPPGQAVPAPHTRTDIVPAGFMI